MSTSGRPSGSLNQPGHSAGGSREGSGRKPGGKNEKLISARSNRSGPRVDMGGMYYFMHLWSNVLSNIYNIQEP